MKLYYSLVLAQHSCSWLCSPAYEEWFAGCGDAFVSKALGVQAWGPK